MCDWQTARVYVVLAQSTEAFPLEGKVANAMSRMRCSRHSGVILYSYDNGHFMAYTSPPPMAEPLLKEKPFGGRILQHMKSVTFSPHPSRCGSAPSTFQEKPFGECICQLSTPAMPDYHPQPPPHGSGQRSWTQGVRSTTEGEIFKGTDGACADPGTQNFPCHGGGWGGRWPGPLPV